MRHLTRRGPVFIAGRLGLQASTVGRVLRRHGVALLRELDPVTGIVIRSTRRTARRYEHDHPGSLVHVDVKKLGRIPDGGGWRADPTQTSAVHRTSRQRMGYDYVHTVIDDHSRLAYAEIHNDEKGATAAGVLERAIAFYAALGITVERVISDNAFAYRRSAAFHAVITAHGITQTFIKPHCPWTNGKVERLNRTLATEWAYARAWTSNRARAAALTAWLDYYNLERPHLGIGGQTPIDRITNGRGQYN